MRAAISARSTSVEAAAAGEAAKRAIKASFFMPQEYTSSGCFLY
jgi:hypothetical protein